MTWIQIVEYIANPTLINNVILLLFFTVFGIQFYRENKNEASPFRWIDLLVDYKTQKLSLTKMGQFWGMAISSWVVIYLSQKTESYSMFPAVFAAWLAFIGGTYALYLKERNKE